ncbi:TPA: lipopolysaccharide biosynthesis protein [Klebsiella pneumoniae]
MNKYNKLVNNSIVFAIGTLGSKLILVILIPLYTFYLSSQDYGVVDLMTSTMSLLMPFITLTLEQALIRYIIKSKDNTEINSYFSSAFIICLITLFLLLLVCLCISFLKIYNSKLMFYFYLMIFFSVSQTLFSTYLRAIGFTKKFAFCGVFQVVVLCSSNIFLLVFLSMGIDGYIISIIVSSFAASVLAFIFAREKLCISFKFVNALNIKTLLLFSIPLIPNVSMWWLVNNSTRYVVLIFIGLSANGLFAVASKLPTLINMFVSVFQQAWQISAFEEFDSSDRSKYYSDVFRFYYQFLFLIASFLLFFNKIVFSYLVSDAFSQAWVAVPWLVLGVLYQTFSSFLGTIYTANLKTKSVFTTSFIGAFIAIATNFLVIPFFGLSAAGVGATLGFFAMWFLRLIDTRKISYTTLNYWEFILFNVLYISQVSFQFILADKSIVVNCTVQMFFMILVLFLSRDFIFDSFRFVISKVRKDK